MKTNSRSGLGFKITLILCGLSLVVVLAEISTFSQEQNRRVEAFKNNAKNETLRASKQLEERLRKLEDSANSIARDLTEGKITDEQLLDRAKQELEQNTDFLEAGAAYTPFAYNPRRKLYGPYYTRKTGKLERVQVEDYYDYTERTPDNEWYHITLMKGTHWNEPYFDKASEDIIAENDAAFYRIDPQTKQKTPAGVVFVNTSLGKLKVLIDSLDVGKSGYGFLLSKKGVLLVHPKQQYARNQTSIFDIAKERKSPQMEAIGQMAIEGKSGVVDFVDDITGESCWVFVQPIALNGWSLAVVVIKNDSAVDSDTKRPQLIRIALETVLFLLFLLIIVCRGHQLGVRNLWGISCAFSFFCVTGIGFIWYLVLSESNYNDNRNVLLSKTNVDKFLDPEIKTTEKLKQKPPLQIPTGVFIQTVKFNSSSDVLVTGFIWQKYSNGVHDGLERGFVLPEGYELDIQEVYRNKGKNSELIGWYFEGTLRQSFDFTKYPFDYNDVLVRIWPKEFNRKNTNTLVFLTPDFSSYEVLNPITKPGLIDKFVSETWVVESSFFEYKLTNFNTNLGVEETGSLKNYPELYFTIIYKRGLIGILIARIIPLSVVAILLFITMLLSRQGGMEVVGACAGLIFVLIVDQIGLRGQIAANGIIYLEYFYFVLYLLILLVAVNAILLNGDRKLSLIEYKNNLLPKVLYWPSLLTMLLIITAVVFY